jgi:hypothetical protein
MSRGTKTATRAEIVLGTPITEVGAHAMTILPPGKGHNRPTTLDAQALSAAVNKILGLRAGVKRLQGQIAEAFREARDTNGLDGDAVRNLLRWIEAPDKIEQRDAKTEQYRRELLAATEAQKNLAPALENAIRHATRAREAGQ